MLISLLTGGIPIVTLDKIYIKPDNENIYFLDCTRINGTNKIVSRNSESVDSQIERLSKELKDNMIYLADDVVFSGSVLKEIISKFNRYGIQVVKVITSICSSKAYEYFSNKLKYRIEANYIMSSDVIDQICERDFYFGVAGSGIMVDTPNGLYKAPYFKPYGNPNERASIPVEYEDYFSKGCLERSIYLWEEIDKLKNRETMIGELPEEIIDTNKEESVVKTLKKGMKRL